jgi:hypothetical protein
LPLLVAVFPDFGAVKLSDFVRLHDAQSKVADATRFLLVLVDVQVRAIFHPLL